jgi:hypothetical protein
MKKPHASTESGKPTKRESADKHQVTREDMGARREQRKRHLRSRKPCRKAIYIFFSIFFMDLDLDLDLDRRSKSMLGASAAIPSERQARPQNQRQPEKRRAEERQAAARPGAGQGEAAAAGPEAGSINPRSSGRRRPE